MGRIIGLLIGCRVAAVAIHGQIHILPVGMALLTIQRGVHAHKREPGALVVRQHLFLVVPHLRCMAFLA